MKSRNTEWVYNVVWERKCSDPTAGSIARVKLRDDCSKEEPPFFTCYTQYKPTTWSYIAKEVEHDMQFSGKFSAITKYVCSVYKAEIGDVFIMIPIN